MWIIGHTAVAYLLIKLIYFLKKEDIKPDIMIFIFIFANLFDSLHFGVLKNFTHSIIGSIVYTAIWLFIFRMLITIKKKEMVILVFAAFIHVITDLLFSNFALFFPFSSERYTIYGWGSVTHLIVGAISVIIFLSIFLSSGDFLRLTRYIRDKNKDFYFPTYVFIVFYAATLLELFLFFITYEHILFGSFVWYWYVYVFFGVFIAFALNMTLVFFFNLKH